MPGKQSRHATVQGACVDASAAVFNGQKKSSRFLEHLCFHGKHLLVRALRHDNLALVQHVHLQRHVYMYISQATTKQDTIDWKENKTKTKQNKTPLIRVGRMLRPKLNERARTKTKTKAFLQRVHKKPATQHGRDTAKEKKYGVVNR